MHDIFKWKVKIVAWQNYWGKEAHKKGRGNFPTSTKFAFNIGLEVFGCFS